MTGTVRRRSGQARRLAAATAGVLTALVGCSASGVPAAVLSVSPSEATSLPAATSASAGSTPASAGSTTSGPTTSPGSTLTARLASACTTSDLKVSLISAGVGLGHWAEILRFHNVGRGACSLRGYPEVVALDPAHGLVVIGVPSLSGYLGSARITTVAVPSGQFASSLIEGGDNPVGNATSCPSYPVVKITPPGTHVSIRVHVDGSLSGCTGIEVHPVVAGTRGGSGGTA